MAALRGILSLIVSVRRHSQGKRDTGVLPLCGSCALFFPSAAAGWKHSLGPAFPFRRPGRCSPAGLPGLAALQSFAPLPFVCRFTVPSHRLAELGWMEAAGLRSWQCASSSPSGGGTLPPSLHPYILSGTRL